MLNKEDILDLAWEHSEASGKHYTFTEESLFEFLKELKKEPAPAQDEREAFKRALSAVIAERDRLAAALSAPDTIKAEPAGDYANLRKQFMSLNALANSNAKMAKYWRDQCMRETRETLLANAANVNAERDTNALLTDSLEAAEAERDRLLAEVEALRVLLSKSLPTVEAHAGASHMLEGFRPTRNKWDELVDGIRATVAAKDANKIKNMG